MHSAWRTTLATGAWLLGAALPVLGGMDGMGRMWLLAGALWLGFKVIAWTREPAAVSPLFLLWVGMDAAVFAKPRRVGAAPPLRPGAGLLGLAAGILLFVGAILCRDLPGPGAGIQSRQAARRRDWR